MRFLNRKKTDSWFALEAHPKGISLAHIKNGKHATPQVTHCEYREANVTADTLKALAQEFDLKRQQCVVVLAPGAYQFMHTNAPEVPEAELKQAVRWAIKDRLDYPVENATLDVLELPSDDAPATRGKMLHVITANNDFISNLQAQYLNEAGIWLQAIDIPETSQRNLAHLLEEPGRGLAMLSFSDHGGMLTLTCDGHLYHARQLDVSLAQLQSEDEERLSYLFDRIALELQRSLDSFERQFPRVSISKLVVAPCPAYIAMCEFLQEYLSIKCMSFDLKDVVHIASEPMLWTLESQARVAGVLGAALRGREA